jgi:hypothetical protein
MKTFERRSFIHLLDDSSGRVLEEMEFRHCYFEGCGLSITRSPARRSTVRNVRLTACEQRGCGVDAAVVDTVAVDGLKTNGLFQTWAAVFRHVILKGKIDRIMLSDAAAPVVAGLEPQEQQGAFDEANAAFYATVDWALDLSEAQFDECDVRGVPGRLIRRDSVTQVVVTRDAAMKGAWRGIDLSGTYWPTALDFFLKSQRPDIVLVAPKRNRNFKRLLDGLKILRDCGTAEPG